MTRLGPDPYISKNFPSKEVFAQNSTGLSMQCTKLTNLLPIEPWHQGG